MSSNFPKSDTGDPTWEIAALFPLQGHWSAEEYMNLNTNRMVEFNEGVLEVLPMPTELHQLIALFLCNALRDLKSGLALVSPFRVRLSDGKFREPDVVFMLHENRYRRNDQFWEGADLAIEIVSPDDPNRDLVTKRREYAEAKIPEYWIVDPRSRTIILLTLDSNAADYREAGMFVDGESVPSNLLPGFVVEVSQVFDQDR